MNLFSFMLFHIRFPFRFYLFSLFALMIFISTQIVWGENTDSPAVEDVSETRLPFRRVFIPEEMLSAIPTRGEAYWPIPAEEFELWATQKNHGTSENVHHFRMIFAEEAVYKATLVENRFLVGTATYRLRKLPTLAHLNPTPTLSGNGVSYTWDFPPVSFAFDNFLSVHPEEKLPFSRRNFNFYPSGAGEVALLAEDFRVDGASTEILSPDGICLAELGWSQSVTPIENGALRIDLAWIPATDTQYVLTLPAEWIPETEEGIVALDFAGNEDGENEEKEDKTGGVTVWRTWRISFGGRRRATVTFRQKDAPKLQDAPISVSQKNIYQFRKEGMDVFVRMNLNSLLESAKFSTKPTRELRVLMENYLIPQKIRFNETEVPWKSEIKTSQNGGTVVTIFLPGELQGAGNRLEINAIGNLDTWLAEGITELRALPRVRLLNSLRRGCRTEVQIYSPLEIVDFSLKDAVVLANQQKAGLEQTQLEFIEYSDVAQFKMMLARLTPKLRIDQATAINFQEHEISAVMELQASVDSGECFEILGVVDRSWTIDAVEAGEMEILDASGKSGESGIIEDWNLDVSPGNVQQALSDLDPAGALPGKLTASGWNLDSLGVLRIQLAHSIRPGYPISLKIRARRLGYANNFTFTGIQLTPLYFPVCQIGQSWLVCGSSTAWKVHFIPPYREQDVYWTTLSTNQERRFMPENGELLKQVAEKPEVVAEIPKKEDTSGVETDSEAKIVAETTPETVPNVESSELLKHFSGFSSSSAEKVGKTPTEKRSLLAEVRKSFPENMMFLTGIQDFKNVPMLRLEHAAKTFTAEIHGFYDITPSPNSLFRIKCDPQGTELERMRVMIRPGALLGSTWKFPRHLSGIEPVCLERQPLEQAEEVNASFELWELRFPQPQREPFEFELVLMTTENVTQDTRIENGEDLRDFWHYSSTGQTVLEEPAFARDDQYSWWREHFPNGFRLPLLDVIDAQKCTGTITLRNDVTDSILTETQEMIPVLLPMEDSIEFKPENAEDCCRYSYVPHTVSNSPGPRLTLIWRERKASVKQAWIWELGCQSQFFTNGKVLHSARFNIENIDAYQLTFTLENPKKRKVDFLGILVNGQRIPAELVILPPEDVEKTENTVRGTKKNMIQHKYRLRIPFPMWRRQSEMVIQWLETVPAWRLCASLTPPKISVDLPVLQKDWDAWIPESYVSLKRFSVFECPPRNTLTCVNNVTSEGKNPAENVNHGENENHTETDNVGSRFPGDTIFLRLFGTMRLGKSIFARPESLTPGEIDSPITLDVQAIRELSTENFFRDSGTSFLAREQMPYSLVGWNECAQEGNYPIFVIYGNILESVRWFLLLFVCFLASWLLAGHRIIRVLVCGTSGTLCMVVPMVWTPVFSGIFLGVAASYLGSSVRHHLRHAAEVGVPVIQVKKDSSSRRLVRKKTVKKTEEENHSGNKKEMLDFDSPTPVSAEKTVIRHRHEAEKGDETEYKGGNGKSEELKNE